MKDSRKQEISFHQIDIPTEEMNETVEHNHEPDGIFQVNSGMDQGSSKIVGQVSSSENVTMASETDPEDGRSENKRNKNLGRQTLVEGSTETDASELENKISKLQSPLATTLKNLIARYGNDECIEEVCQLLSRISVNERETEEQDSEPRFAESSDIKSHGYNKNWKFLSDAFYSKKGKAIAEWNELLESEIFEQKSPVGNTVLHIAARNGNDDLVKKIIEHDFELKLLAAKNSNNDTAMHIAAKAGHFATLKTLIGTLLSQSERHAMEIILGKNNQGNTFFHEAIINRHKDVKKWLVSDDDNLKKVAERALVQVNNEKKSVLYLAIEAGYKELVQEALVKVIIPLGEDYVPEGKSPLLGAIMKGKEGILDIILKQKESWIHLRDTEGRTPLHYAASVGYLEGVRCLLRICASCAMERDNYGYFPLHLASYGGHLEVVKELLKSEHRPHPREMLDNSGRNILHLAVDSGKFNVVRHILQATKHELEKMINDQDDNGNTPLHLATLRCHPKIVHALTWHKRVDLNLVNTKGQTTLDTIEMPDNPSLRQRLTWSALMSAGARPGKPLSSSIKVPPQTTESLWNQDTPNTTDLYKDRINTLILVSTLIITVTFAAGFTIPGGINNSSPGQGMALLLHQTWFKVFIFCITISLYGAISVTIILIWAQLGDITLALVALGVARFLLGIILATLSLAFLAGLHLVITDLSWLATSSLILGSVFIFMLLALYTFLWFPSSSSNCLVRYMSFLPFLYFASLVEPDEK